MATDNGHRSAKMARRHGCSMLDCRQRTNLIRPFLSVYGPFSRQAPAEPHRC